MDGAPATNETSAFTPVGSNWRLFRMNPQGISEGWPELAVHLREIPSADGRPITEDMMQCMLSNLLSGVYVLWIVTDLELRVRGALLGAPQLLASSSSAVFCVEGAWSSMGFDAQVYEEILTHVSAYAKSKGCMALLAHVASSAFAQRLCAAGMFQQLPVTTLWRQL
ncbi:MAG: hypothetical protein BWY63_00270 [Chloroflexi bacterium ADurb.Bin360]|nr:MAG: hypothetical protein BWY63_00270 [Chloroflexi bacterium ADurb.Bin360]